MFVCLFDIDYTGDQHGYDRSDLRSNNNEVIKMFEQNLTRSPVFTKLTRK